MLQLLPANPQDLMAALFLCQHHHAQRWPTSELQRRTGSIHLTKTQDYPSKFRCGQSSSCHPSRSASEKLQPVLLKTHGAICWPTNTSCKKPQSEEMMFVPWCMTLPQEEWVGLNECVVSSAWRFPETLQPASDPRIPKGSWTPQQSASRTPSSVVPPSWRDGLWSRPSHSTREQLWCAGTEEVRQEMYGPLISWNQYIYWSIWMFWKMFPLSKLKNLHVSLNRVLDLFEDDELNNSYLMDTWSATPESPAGENRTSKEELLACCCCFPSRGFYKAALEMWSWRPHVHNLSLLNVEVSPNAIRGLKTSEPRPDCAAALLFNLFFWVLVESLICKGTVIHDSCSCGVVCRMMRRCFNL